MSHGSTVLPVAISNDYFNVLACPCGDCTARSTSPFPCCRPQSCIPIRFLQSTRSSLLGPMLSMIFFTTLQDDFSLSEAFQVFPHNSGGQRVSNSLFGLVCPFCTSSACHTPPAQASQCHALLPCFLVLEPQRTRNPCCSSEPAPRNDV